MSFLRLALLCCATLYLGTVQASTFRPQPFSARYTVHLNGFKIGELERKLSVGRDGRYVLENVMYTTGVVALLKKDRAEERSTWVYEGEHAKPLQYYAHYSGRFNDAIERVDFDWNGKVARALRQGVTTTLPLTPGTLDRLMHQAVLQSDIAAGRTHLEYPVVERNKIATYTYDVTGQEEIVTPRGRVRTIKVQKGTTTFWLAPEWDYLLVQLIQRNKDGTYATYLQP